MMHFPLFQIPPSFQSISQFVRKSTFHKKIVFHPPKFLMTFYSLTLNLLFPLFSLKRYISPISENVLFPSPILVNFPTDFVEFTCFAYFTCFLFHPTFTTIHLCLIQCKHWPPLRMRVEPLLSALHPDRSNQSVTEPQDNYR